MTTPELIAFIRRERALGISEAGYTQALLGQGWNAEDVAEAHTQIAREDRLNAPAPKVNPIPAPVQPAATGTAFSPAATAQPQPTFNPVAINSQPKPATPLSQSPLSPQPQPQSAFAPRIINPTGAFSADASGASASSGLAPRADPIAPVAAPVAINPIMAAAEPVLRPMSPITPQAQEHFIPMQPVVSVHTPKEPSKKPWALILILIFLIAASAGYYYFQHVRAALTPAATPAATAQFPDGTTDVLPTGDTPSVSAPTSPAPAAVAPSSNASAVSATFTGPLQAGAITLTSPTNNQKLISGSKITVSYTLSDAVADGIIQFGSIDQGQNNPCTHFIANEKAGSHSYICTLPQVVGKLNLSLLQAASSTTEPSTAVQGQVSLVVPAATTAKDIQYVPSEVIAIASPNATNQDGYIAFTVLYSDGISRTVDISNFTFTIKDPSTLSIFGTPSGSTLFLHGLKEGATTLIASYNGLQKTIPIEVFPYNVP